MRDNMIGDDAVVKQAMEFAAASLKLKPDAVPGISKARDWSYPRRGAATTARWVRRNRYKNQISKA